MKISLAWLNRLVSPAASSAAPLNAEQAEALLTRAGLPTETVLPVPLPSGVTDTQLDIEVTSNRGDALCHQTMARELVAASQGAFTLKPLQPELPLPAPSPSAPDISSLVTLNVADFAACPRFTLRLIKGVKVAPSPAWLVDALASLGMRSINNIVDATNFLQAELGNPCHVFDLNSLAKSSNLTHINIRPATTGESLTLLDSKSIKLHPNDIVVADAAAPVSLAGVMGGLSSGVSTSTTDVLIEVATWDPIRVRNSARRHTISTDAAYRFQRTVDFRTIDNALNRLTALILHLAGGQLCPGTLDARSPSLPASNITIHLRASRARQIIGLDLPDADITSALNAQGFTTKPAAGSGEWTVTVPHGRTDINLEIDLIEEIARTVGYDRIITPPTIPVQVREPQTSERAARELARVLTACGFYETVTFSFTSAPLAKPFLDPNLSLVSVADDRRGSEGTLRPSILPGLLQCRRVNQDRRVTSPGGVRLYETAAVFSQTNDKPPRTVEHQRLALLADAPTTAGQNAFQRKQAAVRNLCAAIEAAVASLHGPSAADSLLTFTPLTATDKPFTGFDPTACARVTLKDQPLGIMGLASDATLKAFDLAHPVALAELDLPLLISAYPPKTLVTALPTMSATERDLSLIVDESITWDALRTHTLNSPPDHLEHLAFVATFRGKPIPEGKKSVTLRMRFRASDKTLRDEEVNAPVQRLVESFKAKFQAELRS